MSVFLQTDESLFASMETLCDSLNRATTDLAQDGHEVGFAGSMQIIKALAILLQFAGDTKDVVYTDAEEPRVIPFPMRPCVTNEYDLNTLGGPGQVFPCPFLISPTSPRANVGSLLSSVSAVAACNMGIACHRQSFVSTDFSRGEQLRLQAKQFYKTAYELLDRLSYISPDGTLILVYMALCTNMAELEFGNGNVDASREWRSALSDTMACVPEDKASLIYKHFHNTSILYRFEIPAAQAA